MLYLEDVPTIEPFDSGTCTIDKTLVNPLELKDPPIESSEMSAMRMAPAESSVPYSRHINRTQFYSMKSSSISQKKSISTEQQSSTSNHVRRKRDRAMVIRPEKLTDQEGKIMNTVVMVDIR